MKQSKPNILMIMVDQLHCPFKIKQALPPELQKLVGFSERVTLRELEKGRSSLPGYAAIRKNAVFLSNHRIAMEDKAADRAALITGQYVYPKECVGNSNKLHSGIKGISTIASYFSEAGYVPKFSDVWKKSPENISGEPHFILASYHYQSSHKNTGAEHGDRIEKRVLSNSLTMEGSRQRIVENKPACLLDYKYKISLAKASKQALKKLYQKGGLIQESRKRTKELEQAISTALKVGVENEQYDYNRGLSLQEFSNQVKETDNYIHSTLNALERSGMENNTIVILCSVYAPGSQDLRSTKTESVSAEDRTLKASVVFSFPKNWSVQSSETGEYLRHVNEPTSQVDILPTLLGLAGLDVCELHKKLKHQKEESVVRKPVGSDLSQLVSGHLLDTEETNTGTLFVSQNNASLPFNIDDSIERIGFGVIKPFEVYLWSIEKLKAAAEGGKSCRNFINLSEKQKIELSKLDSDPVLHPCHVHCVVDKNNWKLVRYSDVTDDSVERQYELYDLKEDPKEERNLVVYDDFPRVYQEKRATRQRLEEITRRAKELLNLMEYLENRMLT